MLHQHDDGVIIIKRFFEPSRIHAVREAAKDIFKIQFRHFGYSNFDDDIGYKDAMVRLFNEHFDVFQNCGKLVQSGMIELYHLAYDQGLINKLKELGISHPLVCTRPVLFFNHPKLAKEVHYYKTPIHQDYQSMLSSADSVVVWIPLVDVDKDNGAVIFYPGTHKLGSLPYDTVGGFANIRFDRSQHRAIQPELEAGDIAIFSTFLVHESGDIDNDNIRWSCHFRYTNMLDQDFIDRGFPSPYMYRSTATQQ